ncbi:hypothetical protein J5J83_12550 [Azoarcus sp. L1K30]|uniref:hypothetical protein n=1 Tax=Azoarcus sp. L1K30 TaxID=2820277 RepID=UPI001B820651|nr:hypothetical protein [Azoarcus sp. L1K30]MBR0566944.1 hypothetical protein [Azoarcus sp. L1K30]
MVEVAGVVALVCAGLAVSYVRGMRRKIDGLALAEAAPARVARLYLRRVSDTNAFWLHMQATDGRKYCIAAPWELEDTLARLERVGLRLSQEEISYLNQSFA